jgi:hypothetical protein
MWSGLHPVFSTDRFDLCDPRLEHVVGQHEIGLVARSVPRAAPLGAAAEILPLGFSSHACAANRDTLDGGAFDIRPLSYQLSARKKFSLPLKTLQQ